MDGDTEVVDVISVDLFGALVTVTRPDDPAEPINVMFKKAIFVSDDWLKTFSERHLDRFAGAEILLLKHVAVMLTNRSDALARPTVYNSKALHAFVGRCRDAATRGRNLPQVRRSDNMKGIPSVSGYDLCDESYPQPGYRQRRLRKTRE